MPQPPSPSPRPTRCTANSWDPSTPGSLDVTVIGRDEGRTPARSCVDSYGRPIWHRWKSQNGGMKVNDAKRLKELETENGRLKRIVADLTLDNAMLK